MSITPSSSAMRVVSGSCNKNHWLADRAAMVWADFFADWGRRHPDDRRDLRRSRSSAGSLHHDEECRCRERLGHDGNDAARCALPGGRRLSWRLEFVRAAQRADRGGNALQIRKDPLNPCHIDILPTVLHLLGMDQPTDIDGRPLVTAFRDTPDPVEPVAASHLIKAPNGQTQLAVTDLGQQRYLNKAWAT